MGNEITQQDIDSLADVRWWILGRLSSNIENDFNLQHIRALSIAMNLLRDELDRLERRSR